ncbi:MULTISPECIES: S8 family serine peptidase [Paenibacillus]|uniref:S8 family serine peptidase n=1 Tax=Paenibacillus TaxID=44249 RepID=UPI0009D74FB3|nr:S8 family serine peptidase [Paenibacillus odorifer]
MMNIEAKVKIAVIDDGINEYLLGEPVVQQLIFNEDFTIDAYTIDSPERITHGTICAGIIKHYYPEIYMYSLKILSDTLRGNIQKLYSALEWCVQNDIQVVNISLGSHCSADLLETQRVINKVAGQGLVIVSAASNHDYITYPASFSNVIGVKREVSNTLHEGEFYLNDNIIDGIEFTAFARHHLNGKECSNSNSFAAPMITAKVCELIGKSHLTNLQQIKLMLSKMANNYRDDKHLFICYADPDWISDILVCYVNGKCKLDNRNLCVNIHGEIVIPAESAYDAVDAALLAYNENIETLVVISRDLYPDAYVELQWIASKYNKNVVFIDNYQGKDMNKIVNNQCTNIKLWHSLFKIHNIYTLNSTPLLIEEPMVSIYIPADTDFEVILWLKGQFKNNNYNSYFASNHPIGVLYGIDYVPETNSAQTSSYFSLILNKKSYDIAIYVLYGYDISDKIETDIEIDIEPLNGYFQATFAVNGLCQERIINIKQIDETFIGELYNSIVYLLS